MALGDPEKLEEIVPVHPNQAKTDSVAILDPRKDGIVITTMRNQSCIPNLERLIHLFGGEVIRGNLGIDARDE